MLNVLQEYLGVFILCFLSLGIKSWVFWCWTDWSELFWGFSFFTRMFQPFEMDKFWRNLDFFGTLKLPFNKLLVDEFTKVLLRKIRNLRYCEEVEIGSKCVVWKVTYTYFPGNAVVSLKMQKTNGSTISSQETNTLTKKRQKNLTQKSHVFTASWTARELPQCLNIQFFHYLIFPNHSMSWEHFWRINWMVQKWNLAIRL